GALPGPLRGGARGGAPRAHRRNLPARAGPPGRSAVPGPGDRPGELLDVGAVRPVRARAVREARASDRGANWIVTLYWCELAWLGGNVAEAGVLVDVGEDGRVAAGTPRVPAPPSRPAPPAGAP